MIQRTSKLLNVTSNQSEISRLSEASKSTVLLQQAADGDEQALTELLERSETRLARIVRTRLHPQLVGRVREADVVREACTEARQRLSEYLRDPQLPFYLWLRQLTLEKLTDVQRRHLGDHAGEAGADVSLHRGALPVATSASLAAQLLGRFAATSQDDVKAALKIKVQEALSSLESLDREVLVLRHVEQLGTAEIALVLQITKSEASRRYFQALKFTKDMLAQTPGFSSN
jgi:RNA polymerase sigma-70 factor (ECF subfamily)